MSLRSRARSLVRNLLFGRRIERNLDEELQAYVEMDVEEKRRTGSSAREARRQALLEAGGIEQVKERVRDVRAGALVEELGRDAAHAFRLLRTHAGFSGLAIATLALGLGAATAVFSIVDTVVIRALPYADPERLVKICATDPAEPACSDNFSATDLRTLQSTADVFEQVAADDGRSATLGRFPGDDETIGIGLVTDNWLSTLGVRPLIGRDFDPDDGRAGGAPAVILTHDFWRRHFDADPAVLGQTLALDDAPHVIVGVLPPNVLRDYADVLAPLVTSDYHARSLDVLARLKPGVTLQQAGAAMTVIAPRLARNALAAQPDSRLTVQPLGRYYASVSPQARRGLLLMLLAVGLLLLIACANVATLQVSRGSTRRREALIRAALGASRGRLLRQFLLENLALFALGGAAGVVVANLTLRSLTALAVSGGYVPARLEVAVDLRVLAVALLVTLVAGVVFGLAPALQASRVDVNAGLRDSAPSGGDRRRGRTGGLLVVAELALTLVLLAGFGLLIRSFARVYATSGGFDADHLLVTQSDDRQPFLGAVSFWRQALERARTTPGVRLAALTSRPPIGSARQIPFLVQGQSPAGEDQLPRAGDVMVSPEYFRTMQIPLLAGRAFTDSDTGSSPRVVIISESVARRAFGGIPGVVGRRIRLLDQSPMTCCSAARSFEDDWLHVVGVVGDIRQAGLDDVLAMTVYRPYEQMVEHDMFVVARAASSATGPVAAELGDRLASADAAHRWSTIRPMWQLLQTSDAIRLRRFVTVLLGSFAAAGLLLAAIGIYGVASRAVTSRTKEIGLRLALGATRPDVLREVFRRTVTLAAAGILVGSVGALALARLMRAMLFDVGPADPATYASVATALVLVVLAATYLPARRATRVDPLAALRDD